MENWGLVTFRESAVLFDSSTGSVADKKLVTMIVDHELAHQVRLINTYKNFRCLIFGKILSHFGQQFQTHW